MAPLQRPATPKPMFEVPSPPPPAPGSPPTDMREMIAPGSPPPTEDMFGVPAGAAVIGAWEATAGGARYVLVFDPARATLATEVAGAVQTMTLGWSETEGRVVARSAAGGPSASGEGEACMEVVSVAADEMLVKVGKVQAGQCVLGDEVLHFARQVQR